MSDAQVKIISRKTAIFQPSSYVERLHWSQIFPVERPVEVELGTGDGSFIAQWAALQPERNVLGLERLLGRLRKADRKIGRGGLENVRLLRLEAAYFVEYLLPPKSVSALHIYFPDPWPKRKQRKNRLINERFAQATAAALVSGGAVYLRTDDRDYFDQMMSVFGGNACFREMDTPTDLREVLTDFERGFQARGVQTLRTAFQKGS
jgi:tRNA (guanine-N7-)-methyltransferase